ncbi:hypothetical protein Lal_00003635 [Lupinus albus]|nr:hypothetical protein Lal_00003635 [Lupinus albus]
MSNLTLKLKLLKLELGENLLVNLVLISLPTHFGKFKNKKRKNNKDVVKELFAFFLSSSIVTIAAFTTCFESRPMASDALTIYPHFTLTHAT